MTETTNLKLKKPAPTDFYNIDDFNSNADKLDSVISELSSIVDAKADKSDIDAALKDHPPVIIATTAELNALIKAGTADKSALYALTDYGAGDFDGSSGSGAVQAEVKFADESDLAYILKGE